MISGPLAIRLRTAGLLAAGLTIAACGTGGAGQHPAASTGTAGAQATATPALGGSARPGSGASAAAAAAQQAQPPGAHQSGTQQSAAQPSAAQPGAARPLAGKTVGIDPGHNGGNAGDPSYINQLIWNGRAYETCDTTGTQSDSGYTEARFNFNVASYLAADLRHDGARVVLSRHTNGGVGPCVNRRAQILNRAHSSVAIDIHADGGPAWGRGFTVLEPIADGPNNRVIRSSVRFGSDVRAALLKDTGMPRSNYYGHDGVIFRDDLAGLNLTTVPKILIETGNMRNATDARLLETSRFQKRVARAFTAAIVMFLTGR
jgi:N-acetylmuramoyl-L-alanine amidase